MPSQERRAELHAALGEAVRLAIVEALAHSDRAPSELSKRFSLPTNLLSHHLDVLERVGLIERLVSTGDRRRRYVRLVPESLDQLRIAPTLPSGQVLFVCSHNSARSQLAAALWSARTGRPASSAGTHPAEQVHPGAVAAAKRVGLDLTEAKPRLLQPNWATHHVVTVCDQAHEEVEFAPTAWHWSIPDPVADGRADAFDRVAVELQERIGALTR